MSKKLFGWVFATLSVVNGLAWGFLTHDVCWAIGGSTLTYLLVLTPLMLLWLWVANRDS